MGINYGKTPDWNIAVKDATQGKGVEIIVETAGATMDKSPAALAFGGFIGVVGFVAGYKAEIALRAVIGPMIRVQGIAVGSRARFEAMNRAIAQHKLRPVVYIALPAGKGSGRIASHGAGQAPWQDRDRYMSASTGICLSREAYA